jgi:outer membrane lipoprotein SlyB
MKKFLLLILCSCAVTSCARNMNSNTYTDASTPGKVLEGTIINARTVTIKAHDKLQDNTVGGLAGAGAGVAAGSQIGRGSGNIAADIGGAIVGAVAGAYIEDALSTQEGMEYLVKLDKQYIQEFSDLRKKVSVGSKSSVEQEMALSSNAGTKTDIVSVVQTADPDVKVGSHVYVIYTDNRPHLLAQKQGN